MINNLREDILEFLRLAFYHNDFNKNVVTDEIMKLIERHKYISKEEIEKRIDIKIQEAITDKNRPMYYDPVIKQHYDTRIETLQEIKEMLK